jgi:hypothetical protein
MNQYQIPYGEAITLRIGSLRSNDPLDGGDYITPTFAAGDVTTEQDDGTGFENADDATPGLDGSCILLDVSVAEASPPSVLEGRRIYRIVDQTTPVWVPKELQIVTTDHHLAAIPNGVIMAILGNAAGQTTSNIRLASDPGITLRSGYFFIVTSGTGAGQAGYIDSYTAGATFDVVPVATLATALDNTSMIKFYVDRPAWLTSVQAQAAALAALVSTLGEGTVTTGASTTVLPLSACTPTNTIVDQFKGSIVKFKKDTLTAGLRNTSARVIASDNSPNQLTLHSDDALPAVPANGETFYIL